MVVSNVQQDAAGEALDPVVAAVLRALWESANDPGGKAWSLAKRSKRAGIAMSTLSRALTQLEMAALVDVTTGVDGRGSAALNAAGR
jgi:DNA-binding IscR family transcriptional regulator